jgi:hypothetical protein
MKPGWKWVTAMSLLVLGIVVSVSGAATSGSKRDGGGNGTGPVIKRSFTPGPGPEKHLSALAGELGVSEAKLKDALEAVRRDTDPPPPPDKSGPPTRAQMEKHCNAFTDALAKQLGKTGDDVRAAMKAAAKKDIEQAVKDGNLPRSKADRILSDLDQAPCMPLFAFHAGPPGCGGPDDGPGIEKRFEHRLAPPGAKGSRVAVPAPAGAPA